MNPPTIGAPSMVYGPNLVENVKKLSEYLNHVEILLFHTPEQNNIPNLDEIHFLRGLKDEKGLTYSVHLPSSLEIASEEESKRVFAVHQVTEIVARLKGIAPECHILHVPITPPTLTAIPGCYIMKKDRFNYAAWVDRALGSLARIQAETGLGRKLLLENINYSPQLLETIRQEGCCDFCLDIGHLLLGGESVRKTLNRYLPAIKEIHIHGVNGWDEHLSLDVLPFQRMKSWIQCLMEKGYTGILNIEVFSPSDLKKSLAMLGRLKMKSDIGTESNESVSLSQTRDPHLEPPDSHRTNRLP